jgi:hypothetical protein
MRNQFHEGDRVLIRNIPQHIASGSIGTITRVYLSVRDAYEVRLDTTGRRQIMRGNELALVSSSMEASREYGQRIA